MIDGEYKQPHGMPLYVKCKAIVVHSQNHCQKTFSITVDGTKQISELFYPGKLAK